MLLDNRRQIKPIHYMSSIQDILARHLLREVSFVIDGPLQTKLMFSVDNCFSVKLSVRVGLGYD